MADRLTCRTDRLRLDGSAGRVHEGGRRNRRGRRTPDPRDLDGQPGTACDTDYSPRRPAAESGPAHRPCRWDEHGLGRHRHQHVGFFENRRRSRLPGTRFGGRRGDLRQQRICRDTGQPVQHPQRGGGRRHPTRHIVYRRQRRPGVACARDRTGSDAPSGGTGFTPRTAITATSSPTICAAAGRASNCRCAKKKTRDGAARTRWPSRGPSSPRRGSAYSTKTPTWRSTASWIRSSPRLRNKLGRWPVST